MRMTQYFLAAAVLVVPTLLAAAIAGIFGSSWHLALGLIGAISAVGLHTVFIVFMIITGRILREAVRARSLDPSFLDELNVFFKSKKAYPAGIFAAFFVVAAAVLGYGHRAFELSPAVHMLAGLGALCFTLWAVPIELRTLRENQRLLDRAAQELDRLDREVGPALSPEEIAAQEEYSPARLGKWALNFAFLAWLPYLYWSLIVWKGDFTKVSVHPWLELSLVGLFLWALARRDGQRTASV